MNSNDRVPSEHNTNEVAEPLEVRNGSSSEEREGEDAGIVSGRALWFGKRAGTLPDSTSSSRYLSSVDHAIEMPSNPRETIIPDFVIETFSYALKEGKRETLLFNGRIGLNVLEQEASAQVPIIGGFGKVISVPTVPPPYSLLAMVVNPEDAKGFDLDTAVFVHWRRHGEEETIVEAAKYFATDNMLIGRITEAGFYRAIALPSHSFTDSVLKILATTWSELRFCYLTKGVDGSSNIVDSIHQTTTNLPFSPDENEIASFRESLIEWLAHPEPKSITTISEPPFLKLWRLMRLKADTWTALGPVAGDGIDMIGRVTQIDTHPENGHTVIAATAGGGVWRTDNAGECWRPLMKTERTLTMGAVAFAPSNPHVIYAASGEDAGPWNPSWPGAGIYRSDNEGESWILTARTSSTRFSAVMVDPCDPLIVYAAGNKGLHKSINGGRSWIINPGLLSLLDGQVTDVVLDYDHPNRVYIGVYNLGILRSLTGGESLNGAPAFALLDSSPLPTGCDAGWVKLAIGRNGANRSKFIVSKLGRYGERIFTTIDSGDSWRPKTSVDGASYSEWTSVVAVNPSNDSILFVGLDPPFVKISWDQGVEWSNILLASEDQQDIAFDNQNPDRMYLANDTGVHLSANGGQAWSLASQGLAISQIYDLDISERDQKVVACGTQDTGLYYRDDAGVWKSFVASDVTQVAIDPTDSKILYSTGPADQGTIFLSCLSAGSTRATTISLGERGPWVPILKLHPYSDIENPATDRKMFLCGSHTFYHSSDAGRSFQRVDYRLAGPLLTDGEITALEYAPGDPSILYLGTSNGALYKASRGGLIAEDWTRIQEDFPQSPISSIGIDWRNPDYVWIVLAGNGVSRLSRPEENDQSCNRMHVVRTSDGGCTWANASGRIMNMRLPDVPMSAIALDPFDRNVAYVGTDVGVFRTSDGGLSWLSFQDGLPRSPVTELRLNRAQRILFAATMGRGVYRRSLD